MTTPVWTRLDRIDETPFPTLLLKRLEELRQREGSVWQDQSKIFRNPLNPDQIAVVDPILPRIPDSPPLSAARPPQPQRNLEDLDEAVKRMEKQMERKAELGERLDQLTMRNRLLSRWIEIIPVPPWQPLLLPVASPRSERRRKIPA